MLFAENVVIHRPISKVHHIKHYFQSDAATGPFDGYSSGLEIYVIAKV